MFAELHAREGAGRVHVIGRADHHGVDRLALVVEHLPEIFVLFRFGPELESRSAALPIDIGQRDYVLHFGPGVPQVAEGLPSRADSGEIDLFVGRFVTQGFQRRSAPEPGRWNRAGEQGAIKEVTSSEVAMTTCKVALKRNRQAW